MKIVVLGAGGQLGRELAGVWADEAIHLTRSDLDLREADAVCRRLREIRPSVVVNAAADNRVDLAESDPGSAFATNATGAAHVARVCAQLDALLVHTSTDYVFDGRSARPYHEDDRPNPLNAYARSKHAGERLVAALAPRHVIIRLAGLYAQGGSRGKGGSFVDRVLARARAGESLRIVDDQVTAPTWARDVAQVIARLIPRWQRDPDITGILHVSNAGACSWYEFARNILALCAVDADLKPVASATFDAPAARPAYSVLANARLASLGEPSLRDWHAALCAYLHDQGEPAAEVS